MSKRASTSVRITPTKFVKTDNVWASIPDADGKDKRYTPVEGGPKTKVLKTMILNYTPRVEVSISLNGATPELRFTDPTSVFTMTGQDFMIMTGTHFGDRSFERVRMEPREDEEDGYRLAKYDRTSSGMSEVNPSDIFNLSKYAARRLKTKQPAITDHVVTLMESEEVILSMFTCVSTVYRGEYERLNSLLPITEHFHELSRIVEIYVPGVAIVKLFLDKLHEDRLVSKVNHYNLLATVLAQKDFMLDLIQKQSIVY